jgi:hypothetical protein
VRGVKGVIRVRGVRGENRVRLRGLRGQESRNKSESEAVLQSERNGKNGGC